MAEVISLVTGRIPRERMGALESAYRDLVRDGLPPTIEDTFLVRTADDRVGILTLWHQRGDLDAVVAGGEEPPARRLIRLHGGKPEATFWDVSVRGSLAAGSSDEPLRDE